MSASTSHGTAARAGLLRFAPPAIAAAHFGFSYVFAALACARRWADAQLLGFDVVSAGIVIATLLSLAAVAAVAIAGRRRARASACSGHRFLADAARALTVLAAAAVLLTGAPVLVLPSCW